MHIKEINERYNRGWGGRKVKEIREKVVKVGERKKEEKEEDEKGSKKEGEKITSSKDEKLEGWERKRGERNKEGRKGQLVRNIYFWCDDN